MVQINILYYELIIIMAAFRNNYVGYYNLDGKFHIMNIPVDPMEDGRKVSRGKVATTYPREELVWIATELGLEISTGHLICPPARSRLAIAELIERHIPIMASPGPWSRPYPPMTPFHTCRCELNALSKVKRGYWMHPCPVHSSEGRHR